jgi:hypothetical protein
VIGLSQRAFARLAGVTQQAISAAVRDGRLILAAGKLDPEHPTNAAFIACHAPGSGSASGTCAQVRAFQAKARLLRHRLEDQEATLVERDAYLRRSLERVPVVRAWLAGIPERRAEELAAAVGCPVETAPPCAVRPGAAHRRRAWRHRRRRHRRDHGGMTSLAQARAELHELAERRDRLRLRVRRGELVE